MNPLKYQKKLPSVNQKDEEMRLGCLFSPSSAMYCDKCGFATTEAMTFKNHMLEHMTNSARMKFYCFYCNQVFFSERDLQAHLHQHTTNYHLRCQFCGLGCVSSEQVAKHVQLVHGKSIGLNNPDISSAMQVPASAALPRVRGPDEPSSLRPMVRVTIPPTATPQASQGCNDSRRVNTADKSYRRVKTSDTNVSSVPKGETNLLPSVSTPIQYNRALTVSLPEEVIIPAGCMVELVEVKTVNGTKELKLRLVSQHENESVVKDGTSTITQNSVLHRPLSSTVNNPNALKLGTMGAFTVKRKQCEKNVDVEEPAAYATNIANPPPHTVSTRIRGTKRTLQETNQNANRPSVLPTKVARGVVDLANEAAQTKSMHPSAAYPSIVSAKTGGHFSSVQNSANIRACVSNNTHHDKKTFVVENSIPNPPKNIACKLEVAVKKELGETSGKYNASPDIKNESVKDEDCILGQNPASVVPATAGVQGMSSSACKEEIKPDPASLIVNAESKDSTEALQYKQMKGLNTSTLTQSEREGFPVISSVFSLSQHLDVQGSIQPLVMALRGIVMDNRVFSDKTFSDHTKKTAAKMGNKKESVVTSECGPQVKEKDNKEGQVGTHHSSDVKIKVVDTCSQYTQTQNRGIKEEKNGVKLKDDTKTYQNSQPKSFEEKVRNKDSLETGYGNVQTLQLGTHERSDVDHQMVDTCCQTVNEDSFDIKLNEGSAQEKTSHKDSRVTATEGMKGQIPPLNGNCISSRFLIVSLKRIQSGLWQKSSKRLKLKKVTKSKTFAAMGKLCDHAIFNPAPLKVDQLVIRPGPNQPVVVLNHPKPKVAKRTGSHIADTKTSEVVPSCQILKMRLSKVMGHKYEVIGCTVRVFS